MPTYPQLPDELPADPIAATTLLERLYRAEWASWRDRLGWGDDESGPHRAVIRNRIGWEPPALPRRPFRYTDTGTPPDTLRPLTGWHSATEGTSSSLCTEVLALEAAVETLRATAEDGSAAASTASKAGTRADVLATARAALQAEIAPSSRAWLAQLRGRLATSTPPRPQPAAATALRPR